MRKYVLSGLASLLMTALTFALMALSVTSVPSAQRSATQVAIEDSAV